MRPLRCLHHLLQVLPASFRGPSAVRSRSRLTAMHTLSSHMLWGCRLADSFSGLLSKSPATGGRTTGNRGPRSFHREKRKWRPREFCTRAGSPRQVKDDAAVASSLSQPCFSVSIHCCKRDSDTFSEALLCFGASSASIDEPSDLEDDEEICITSIFTIDQDVSRCISFAAKSIGLRETPNFEVTVSEHFDWVANVKETFQPIQVTDGLWVVPEWRTPPDVHATNIFLNPGMAFGTGEHPTTRLCLILLNKLIKGGERVLDYGTGSGILGIAAIKMGAAFSVGIDIEPQALSSAGQNIALNAIESGRMALFLAPVKDQMGSDGLKTRIESFDVIVANILLNPIMELAEELVSYGKPGAVFGLSGILHDQVPQVEEKYSKYLESITVSEMNGWACLTGTKR